MKKKEPDSEEKDKMEIEAMQQTLNQIKINTTALRKQIDLAKKTKKKTDENQTVTFVGTESTAHVQREGRFV